MMKRKAVLTRRTEKKEQDKLAEISQESRLFIAGRFDPRWMKKRQKMGSRNAVTITQKLDGPWRDRDSEKFRCINKGENNASAKITSFQAEEIRRIYASKKINQRELGAMFGISQDAVSKIVRGVRW